MRTYYKEKKTDKNIWGQTYTVGYQIYYIENGQRVDVDFVDSRGAGVSPHEAAAIANRKIANLQSSYESGQAKTEEDVSVAKGEFEEQLGEYKGAIEKAGTELEQLAEKRSARTTGVMTRAMANALLAQGEDPARLQAVQGRIKAASGRQLQDVLSGVKAQTLQQLAGAEKFDVTAGMDFDQIQLQRQSLQDAMIKFLADQQLQRDKFQAQIDMQPDLLQTAVGSFGQGLGQGVGQAGTMALLASDKRLKENISQVGTLDNGLPVYVFNFKGDTKTQIGLMAQDVEKVNKDAVIEIDGIKFLNYKMAVQ